MNQTTTQKLPRNLSPLILDAFYTYKERLADFDQEQSEEFSKDLKRADELEIAFKMMDPSKCEVVAGRHDLEVALEAFLAKNYEFFTKKIFSADEWYRSTLPEKSKHSVTK